MIYSLPPWFLLTPGERIGWLALSPSIPDREILQDAIGVSQIAAGWLFPNAVLQHALNDIEGLSIDLTEIERKRDTLEAALRDARYELRIPEATFYLWVRSPDPDDTRFCRLLAERKVLVLPGSICEVPGHFRISLSASRQLMDVQFPFSAILPWSTHRAGVEARDGIRKGARENLLQRSRVMSADSDGSETSVRGYTADPRPRAGDGRSSKDRRRCISASAVRTTSGQPPVLTPRLHPRPEASSEEGTNGTVGICPRLLTWGCG